jgi:hypothetical protein
MEITVKSAIQQRAGMQEATSREAKLLVFEKVWMSERIMVFA